MEIPLPTSALAHLGPSEAPVVVKPETALQIANRSDAALVRAAQRGKRDAVTEIYERYWRVVHAAILARVPSQGAEDILQDVFAAAVRRLPSVRKGESLGGWLLTIARNRAADYWRRTQKTGELPEDLAAKNPPRAEANQVLAHIRALPDAYRETLIMRFVEGMTGPEIAERTGHTHGSVRVNLHRGMALLREALATEDV
jgi:RNA polymerase sigma-70 factor (ECF subfamily)